MDEFTIGADPEFFVKDIKTNKIVSAIGIIPGTKDKPHKCEDLGFLHRDNVLGELNVPVSKDPIDFMQNTYRLQLYVEEKLREAGYTMDFRSSHEMDQKDLMHYEAMHFGCEPDYDAWFLDPEGGVSAAKAGRLRTAGGHLHIGCELDVDVHTFVRTCDIFIGLPSVLLDEDTKRRTLYGRAGRFRPKPYGIEYRTPSPFWLKSTELMAWVGEAVRRVVSDQDFSSKCIKSKGSVNNITSAINTSNKEMALRLCRSLGLHIPRT